MKNSQPKLRSLVAACLQGDDRRALCEYLTQVNHPDAPALLHVENPLDLIRPLIGNELSILDVLHLPMSSSTKLDFVLRRQFVPEPIFFSLACDFADHVLANFESWNPHDLRPREAIEASRQWQIGLINDTELFDACHNTKFAAQSARRAGYDSAAFAANAAGAASDEGGDARDVSYYARLSEGTDQELDWQVQHLVAVLEKIENNGL